MSQVINRRTVVRGAAWSIPVVAVAANAPAFAASTDAPGYSSYLGCKTPGDPNGPNCQGYRLIMAFDVQGPYEWTIVLDTVKVDGVDYTTNVQPTRTFTVSATSPSIEFRVCTTSSPGQITLEVAYTASSPGLLTDPTPVVVPATKVKLDPCK